MRLAIIGCGLIGGKRAAAAATHEIVVCCDRDLGRAEQLAKRTGARAVGDWREAIAADVDAVIVATPHDQLAGIALALIVLNCIWVALCFGILSTRYRDISPLLFSLVQLLFYMTPIIWNDETLRQQGAGGWAKIIEFNPLLHYVDIVRAPLLGADQELRHWVVVIVLTIVGWIVTASSAGTAMRAA